ncbi:hypothetical protein HD554DRAFT_2170512 [Boletus coccyginus]|nr:hypothetical protein HD554DRAFT_2170512 [Boletus coccyginus]
MQQQVYPVEHKGTLLPGQTISVNKYAVQVERYLSQGGFSYVYLVRTATPVYNTTRHVLKRIAVPSEALLTEVKKEVDIMRILKGHPNIVHLIDAAWHRMSNGQYEVFILMEFCPGGGIIDMMNRRLRERLTEAEILQIFVDVLEGVAAMHNLRPALLHRDLKVENILQSSSTSFKLCDFGSATPVAPRPPSTTQEIRYRPPEMIDPYLRRPVDEKSDVWALGVLLYKLCYYTTPFEEHGSLAILNVQYRIPPYPVYSPQLNGLIVSMLREHGAQRPSVFELLAQVHHMRGTKSRFTYHIALPQSFSPRTFQPQSTTPPDNSLKNTGIQARDKVLEAIAPMRRGRPSPSQQHDLAVSETSKPPSPPKLPLGATKPPKVDLLGDHFGVEEDNAWRVMKSTATSDGAIKGPVSSSSAMSAWKPKGGERGELDATWSVESLTSEVTDVGVRSPSTTFGDNFAENLWNAYDGNRAGSGATPSISAEKVAPAKIAPLLEGSRTTKLVITKGKDAFEGLGLTSSTHPAPTLGEARKLRTGLASVNAYNRPTGVHSSSSTATKPKPTTASTKPTPSPRPSLSHTNSSWRVNPATQTMSGSISSTTSAFPQIGDPPAETRFPSLEELDATMSFSQKPTRYTTQTEPNLGDQNIVDLSVPSTSAIPLRPQHQRSVASSTMPQSSTRSEQVTGTPVRETAETSRHAARLETGEGSSPVKRPSGRPPSRLSSSVKRTANASSKPLETQDLLDMTGNSTSAFLAPQKTREHKDWLTGDIDSVSPTKDRGVSDTDHPETPVLREFTHKRSSFVEENNVHIQSPQEAITGEQPPERFIRASISPSPTRRNPRSSRSKERKHGTSLTSSHKNPMLLGRPLPASSTRSLNTSQDSATGSATRPSFEPFASSDDRKTQPTSESPREGKISSSDEESPEDAVGFRASKSVEKTSGSRRKGRQSSVHDLVDLWGGGVVQTRERRKDSLPNPSTDPPHDSQVAKPPKSRSIAIPSAMKFNTTSPQHLQPARSGAMEVPRSPSRSPNRRSPNSHMKQMSAVNPTSGTPTAASRNRPQSLFVFPMSKSTSDGKLETPATPPGLSVPQDGSRVGGSRRPSITDMVQKYEAIGKVSSPLPKSAVAQGVTPTTTGRALQQSLHSPMTSKFSPSRVAPASDDISPAVDTEKRQLLINPKSSYSGPTEKWVDTSRGQGSVSGLPITSPSKLLSLSSSQGGIDGLPSATTLAPKATTPPEEDTRAPSPEKPYQGVGKLIDQWQRKSEEASRGPVPRRGLTTKRAGLVGGGVSRDN